MCVLGALQKNEKQKQKQKNEHCQFCLSVCVCAFAQLFRQLTWPPHIFPNISSIFLGHHKGHHFHETFSHLFHFYCFIFKFDYYFKLILDSQKSGKNSKKKKKKNTHNSFVSFYFLQANVFISHSTIIKSRKLISLQYYLKTVQTKCCELFPLYCPCVEYLSLYI